MYGVKFLVAVGLGVAGSFGTYQAIAGEGSESTQSTKETVTDTQQDHDCSQPGVTECINESQAPSEPAV